MDISPLQKNRHTYSPKLPPILRTDIRAIAARPGAPTEAAADQAEIRKLFPATYGMPMVEFTAGENQSVAAKRSVALILSGGQAPGGHNVIAGLFDALKRANPASQLIGFLGGPSGILDDSSIEITSDIVDRFRNTGGFDMIGSGRTKLETPEQFERARAVFEARGITALVVVGGDDSNTNAAILAEHFKSAKSNISVVGVPKTIDGDLKNEYIETSFGFDTATKTYAELIGNIERDANSAKKYWHFIKLMGRSASHIALECALQTQPNIAIISEEVERYSRTLGDVVDDIAQVVAKRAHKGESFGVVLVPEGLIEFIPEIKQLIEELNTLLATRAEEFALQTSPQDRSGWVASSLSKENAALFSSLPSRIRDQLLADRDPHGNVQVSRIDTEILLSGMVGARLAEMAKSGSYNGKFSALHHFFGYEGRCAFPSNFDADYCYSLGYNAFLLVAAGRTGYMSVVKNLSQPVDRWVPAGVPITMLFNLERRHGEMKPVIRKALVELDGAPFRAFAKERDRWAAATSYLCPGAIQYWGPAEVCDQPTLTLKLERKS